MRLSGACSNQRQLAVVRKAAEARSKLTTTSDVVSTREAMRLRHGAIQKSIIEVLMDSRGALSPAEIRNRVAYALDRKVSYDTVARYTEKSRSSDARGIW